MKSYIFFGGRKHGQINNIKDDLPAVSYPILPEKGMRLSTDQGPDPGLGTSDIYQLRRFPYKGRVVEFYSLAGYCVSEKDIEKAIEFLSAKDAFREARSKVSKWD